MPTRGPLLHALTIHRPWSWAIAQRLKPVENRDWPPPTWLLGHYFAIHAGKTYDVEGADWMRENAAELGLEAAPGVEQLAPQNIVATARLAGAIHLQVDELKDCHLLEVRGDVPRARVDELLQSPWTIGPWSWVLEDVVAIPGVPCRGMQKLWLVPRDIRDQVRVQYRAARAA